MKTYLTYKSNKFWEVTTQENGIISKYGKIGSEEVDKTAESDSDAIAAVEMYQQIIATPDIVMDELLENYNTSLEAIEKELYSDLEGNYGSVFHTDVNLSLQKVDLDDYMGKWINS